MKLRNPNLAGVGISTPQGIVTGDENGIFDLDDATAAKVAGTPGWSSARAPRAAAASQEAQEDAPVDDPTSDTSEGTDAPQDGSQDAPKPKRKAR